MGGNILGRIFFRKVRYFYEKSIYKRQREKSSTQKQQLSNTTFWEYEEESAINSDSWRDPYGDERAYYDGWSREDVESGLTDAYE